MRQKLEERFMRHPGSRRKRGNVRLRIWCDSGANAQSKWEEEINTSELGFTDEQWSALSDEDKEAEVREVAFERLDWGYEELKEASK